MRIQLVSDLHLEFLAQCAPGERLFQISPEADVLVLAGDIAAGAAAIGHFADAPVPVLYVLGNHEHYGAEIDSTLQACREAAAGTAVTVLEEDAFVLDGVRFLGCTLWTDYRFRSGLTPEQNMLAAERELADHYAIHQNGRLFTAADALRRHTRSLAWLDEQLRQWHRGRTVVVTHHGPHPRSVHQRFLNHRTMALNGAFVSELSEQLARADLWLHGHVHDCFDYHEAGCRVVANPRGYVLNRGCAASAADFEFENPAFRGELVLTI